jgi:hypothetical protein
MECGLEWIGTVPSRSILNRTFARQVGPTMREGERRRMSCAIRDHTNLTQIWSAFGSSRTLQPSVFEIRRRVGLQICPARPIQKRGRSPCWRWPYLDRQCFTMHLSIN